MDSFVQAILVVLLCGLASTVTALDCYQCNLNCHTGTGEGCRYSNTTENREFLTCENDTQVVSDCVACMKVKTTVRRYVHRSEFASVDIISKICQKDESLESEDTCDSSGPTWATDVICHCFSDLCNSATESLPFLTPIIACILFHLL